MLQRIGLYDAYLATLGGGENFLAVFAELMEKEFPRADVEIITHDGNHVDVSILAERFGVTLQRTRIRRLQLRSRSFMPVRPLRRFFHERDVALISSEYDLFLNNTIFSVAPSRARHGIYMCMFPLSPEPWSLRELRAQRWFYSPYVAFRRRLYRRWVGSYDLVLANSDFTRQWIQRIWDLPSEVLYPPVETRTQHPRTEKRNRILAIGRFFPGNHNKKHDVLIQAFRRLRREGLEGWELHLVGGKTPVAGTDEYVSRLERMARGEPIHFHFDADRAELEDLLVTSSLFWHATGFGEQQDREPEKLEHFGMSTVEAMTYGCVPLVFHCGGQPEIIEQGKTGMLWRTLDELHRQTLLLVEDRALREILSRAAHARSQQFSRSAFRRRALELLGKLPVDRRVRRIA